MFRSYGRLHFYDEKQGVLFGKETKRKLASGDQVRVRITAVSLTEQEVQEK
jgi:DNA-directed RNA polymerase subunit E'/Rpb7